jgi:hypothetical protein
MKPTLPFQAEHEQNIRDYAATLTTIQLAQEIKFRVNRAIAINNSGAFRVASLLMIEFETRADADQSTRKKIRKMRTMIDFAIRETHK